MSEGEQKLADAAGNYLYAVRSGEPVADPTWRSCRVVLTDRRLVLATSDGKQGIPHGTIRVPEDDDVVPDGVTIGEASPFEIGDNVVLVDTQDIDDFTAAYCRATLHDEVVLAKTPAVVGGVVQEEATWSKARCRPGEDRLALGLPGGETTAVEFDDVGTVETAEETVTGETRTVVRVEHTDAEGRAIETHLSGMDRHSRALAALFRGAVEARDDDYELSDAESEVLMALYSGVSPFEMAEFVGLDVEEVEEIYQRLLDAGAVDKVRERTEVALNAQGRNMASEAMSER